MYICNIFLDTWNKYELTVENLGSVSENMYLKKIILNHSKLIAVKHYSVIESPGKSDKEMSKIF